MKFSLIILLITALVHTSCTNGQTQTAKNKLTPAEFAGKIKEMPDAQILDVRTTDEFSKEHLNNSLHVDWYSSDFEEKIALLEKSKPLFVYCLSGNRSASAATKLRASGFSEVYELEGGIMKWKSAELPVTSGKKTVNPGMTMRQFDELIDSEKLILIDYYAEWCVPCKKMKPFLDEISIEMVDKLTLVRINADENPEILKHHKIDAIPVLQLYKDKKIAWTHKGFISKEDLQKKIQ